MNENGSGQLEDCDILGNAFSGVAIKTGGNPTVRRCTIKNNIQHGVYAHDNGRGTIEACNLRGNQREAWNIDSSSQVQRRGNKE